MKDSTGDLIKCPRVGLLVTPGASLGWTTAHKEESSGDSTWFGSEIKIATGEPLVIIDEAFRKGGIHYARCLSAHGFVYVSTWIMENY